MTDADVDGMAISSLICTFFTIHMPEIVTGGYLYRAVPPLYSFIPKNSKKEVYLTTYYEYCKLYRTSNIRILHYF